MMSRTAAAPLSSPPPRLRNPPSNLQIRGTSCTSLDAQLVAAPTSENPQNRFALMLISLDSECNEADNAVLALIEFWRVPRLGN